MLTSMVYCFHLWRSNHDQTAVSERVQSQTWFFIIPFAIFQLATGFTMISVQHYNASELWIMGSIIGFIFLIGSWFGFIYCLLSAGFRRLQAMMLVICTLTLFSMIFFMANRVI